MKCTYKVFPRWPSVARPLRKPNELSWDVDGFIDGHVVIREDFPIGRHAEGACVVGVGPATRVNITSTAARFSSRRRKHKHLVEAAAGARLPPVPRAPTYGTTRKSPNRHSSRPRAPASAAHAYSHVLRPLRR